MTAKADQSIVAALARAVVLAASILSIGTAAQAGEVARKAAEAETLLQSGEASAAFDALNAAVNEFWSLAPFIIHSASVASEGGNSVASDPASVRPVRSGEKIKILVEPLGYGFTESGGEFTIALKTGIEIRTPGGLILARTDDFEDLKWSGPVKNRSFTAKVGVELPKLKPGNYEILLTLTDQASGGTASATLPFEVSSE
jgi:hypothetical protein